MKDNKIIGEIIEVSSRSAIAQSYELYDCPPIGSVVKCGDDTEDIYGVITSKWIIQIKSWNYTPDENRV